MNIDQCRSCGKEIFWARTTNNQSIPLDAEPVETGNIAVTNGIARTVEPGEVLPGTLLYTSHFITCPQAPGHRKAVSVKREPKKE